MTDEEFTKLRNRIIKSYIRISGDSNDSEDAAQSVLCKWISKNSRTGQTVDQAVIDYLRTINGDKRACSYDQRRHIFRPQSLESLRDSRFDLPVGHSIAGDPELYGRMREEALYFERVTDSFLVKAKLTKREIEILKAFSFGYENEDIAKQLSVSNSRISQIKKSIANKIQNYIYEIEFISLFKNTETRSWLNGPRAIQFY